MTHATTETHLALRGAQRLLVAAQRSLPPQSPTRRQITRIITSVIAARAALAPRQGAA